MISACMFHFQGGVPQPILQQTLDRSGAGELVKQIDERYLNEEIRIWGGNVAVGAQMIFQQKLVLSTTF
jgi:hypothetical protein